MFSISSPILWYAGFRRRRSGARPFRRNRQYSQDSAHRKGFVENSTRLNQMGVGRIEPRGPRYRNAPEPHVSPKAVLNLFRRHRLLG
jgi:hypothetical protein